MTQYLLSFTLFFALFSTSLMAECVHEYKMTGRQILSLGGEGQLFIEKDQRFIPKDAFKNLNPEENYTVQWTHKTLDGGSKINKSSRHDDYNRRYVEYYTYARMGIYLNQKKSAFEEAGYELRVIGKSVQGRNLYAVTPKTFDPSKKTILMYGRHHGDEGTANWIIEGFLNNVYTKESSSFHDKYQLVLYPMINPDGAEAHTRYNANGYDLNRVWYPDVKDSKDEIKTIQAEVNTYLAQAKKIVIALDMHGSFVEDFIYRVDYDFLDRDFYNHQSEFINFLGRFDPWQAGNYELSDGHRYMARIYLVRDHKINALTHESIRDLERNGSRSVETLKQQGDAVYQAITGLY